MRQAMLDLVCDNRPGRARKPRQHCSVITSSSAYMDHILAIDYIERQKADRVQN